MLSKVILFVCLFISASSVSADGPAPVEYQEVVPDESVMVEQNFSVAAAEEYPLLILTRTVKIEEAVWLSFILTGIELGDSGYILIKSTDGVVLQKLTEQNLSESTGHTAPIKRSELIVEAYAGSAEDSTFFDIEKIIVGGKPIIQPGVESTEQSVDMNVETIVPLANDESTQESICEHDFRLGEDDVRIGRIFPKGCTAFLISEGLLVTAGHCNTRLMNWVQFNVPASDRDGTLNFPPPEDQYAIDIDSIKSSNDGEDSYGDDWAVFKVHPNTKTGLIPHQQQESHFEIDAVEEPTMVKISGYGLDRIPNGENRASFNDNNQTLQKSKGKVLEFITEGNGVYLSYMVDTEKGNSGSPVIVLDDDGKDTGRAVGIHTDGGCDPARGVGNKGTSFRNVNLLKAIEEIADNEN